MNGFFQDASGNFSMTRLLMFIMIVYALLLGVLIVFKEDSYASLAFISGIVTLSGTIKLIQNGQEKK